MKKKKFHELLIIEGTCIRTRELNEQGFNDYKIKKLITENIIKKIYQGVYQLVDCEKLTISDINVIIENGIISMTSAAFYYKLLDGEEGKITITLDRDKKPPKMPYEIFNYYYTTTELYKLGLNIIDQKGKKIKIYDQERTICDIIKHRSKHSDEIIQEILKNYLGQKNKDMEKLFDYAHQMRVYNIIIKYIAVIAHIN